MDRVAPDLRWDLPLRLLGALHYLVLAGLASWDDAEAALDEHAGFLRRHLAEQQVQTNEVQRAWALLPAFLSVADGRPLDVLELGPSAGLNLVWDRYAYAYRSGSWGASSLTLAGDDRVSPPAELLAREVVVARRRGIDRSPVDVTTEHGARVLQSFVWADQVERQRAPSPGDRGAARRSARAHPGRLRRVARAAPRRPDRGHAARRLPDRVDDVPVGARSSSACAG